MGIAEKYFYSFVLLLVIVSGFTLFSSPDTQAAKTIIQPLRDTEIIEYIHRSEKIEIEDMKIEVINIENLESENFTVMVLDDQEIITGEIMAMYDGHEVAVGKMYGVLYG